jgi:Collagen triple helix repeat (20 copies)
MLDGQVLASLRHHCPTIRGGKLISRIHNKLGTAGFIVAIVALIAALGGAAIAAVPKLSSKQKQEVTKIAQKEAKKFPGPAGPQGPAGAPGAAGKDGAQGAQGAQGEPGEDGTDGKDGKNGNSVVVAAEPEGGNCEAGGVKVTVQNTAGQNYVCNGKDGGGGGVLAPGESEYGHWGYGAGGEQYATESISFNPAYPVAAGPELHFVTFEEVEEEEAPAACPGTVSEPEAEPGNLCVYQQDKGLINPSTLGEEEVGFEKNTTNLAGGTDAYGVTLFFFAQQFNFSTGTWVVTAPEAP